MKVLTEQNKCQLHKSNHTCCVLSIVIVILMSITIFTPISSNVNEVIRAELNSLFFFTKRFHTYIGGLTKSAYQPGLTNLVYVGMYALTLTYLVSPVHYIVETNFLFFLCAHKKYKHAHKRINDVFPLRFFLSTILIFVRLQRFVLLPGCVFVLFVLLMLFVLFVLQVLLVLLVRAKSSVKK